MLDGKVLDVTSTGIVVQSGPISTFITMKVNSPLADFAERPHRVQVRPDVEPLDPEGRVYGQSAREGRTRPLQNNIAQIPQQRLRKWMLPDRV